MKLLRGAGRRSASSDYAQDALGDIVYIDLPETESHVAVNAELGEIESTKATVSRIIAPVSGTIVDISRQTEQTPRKIINEDSLRKRLDSRYRHRRRDGTG
ncbi:MAG: glycine cleavage system protein H [Desulfobacterales bacterium]|nr:glycine cleavage system protein H [Desulfobacterales bacterium]